MNKTTCDIRLAQEIPNASAMLPSARIINYSNDVLGIANQRLRGIRPAAVTISCLFNECNNQAVNCNGLGQRHSNDSHHHDATKGAGITPNRFGSFASHEANTYARSSTSKSQWQR